MPVTEQIPVVTHNGNGVTTVFAYNYKILAAEDMEVTVDGVVKTLTTDYSVSGVGVDGGGSVTMITPPASGTANVVLRRNMAYSRSNDYQDNGDLLAATADDDSDRPIMMMQQLVADIARAMKLPVGVTTDQVVTESAADRVGKLISFDASGNMILAVPADVSLTTVSAFIATLLDDADAAAARATLGIGTSDLTMAAGKVVIFEGATDDAYETTLTVTDPTADRTITLPNESMTVAGRDVAQTFTAKQTIAATQKVQQSLEKITITAAAPAATQNFDWLTQAIQYFTTNGANNWTLNVRGDGSNSLDSLMAVGESITLTVMAEMGGTPYYANAMTIDGGAVTPKWVGGTAPSAGDASCINLYTYTIVKTAAATFTVVASKAKTS